MNLVPECYREKLTEIIHRTFERTLQNEIHKPHALELFINELRNDIYGQLEPIMPGSGEVDIVNGNR